MSLFSLSKTANEKEVKILGITVYKKSLVWYKNSRWTKRRLLFGLFKSLENFECKIYYFLGIRILKKIKNSSKLTPELLKNLLVSSEKRMAYVNQRLIIASNWNKKAFESYKGAFKNKTVVLFGAGPTVNFFEPINDEAIYVGCNRAFLCDKVKFDFLFSIDKRGIETWYDDFFNYRKDECIKFIGDQNVGERLQIPEYIIPSKNVYRYITYAGIERVSRYNLDISLTPLHNASTVTIQALQFILYTHPKRIYIVGVDCTSASNVHFICTEKELNGEISNGTQGHDCYNKKCYKQIKEFAQTYYPDIEIISINPVGLTGLFKDVYTKGYLDANPEIKTQLVNPVQLPE